MVDVAQLVRAPVCGTGGRGFKSRHPPHIFFPSNPRRDFLIVFWPVYPPASSEVFLSAAPNTKKIHFIVSPKR